MNVYYINEDTNGSAYLAVGEKVVMFDPGMAWCGPKTVADTKALIGDRPVDAILLTHAHYDHVAALPSVRQAWPDVQVYVHEYGYNVMMKSSARATMRHLSEKAAEGSRSRIPDGYDEDMICADRIIKDGDLLTFGDIKIRVIATPGHTKDSMSFMVNEKWLIAAETMGVLDDYDCYGPQYLISCRQAFDSMERIRKEKPEYYCMPHIGIVRDPVPDLFERMQRGLTQSRETIFDILKTSDDRKTQLAAMEKAFYRPEHRKASWPVDAFDINAGAMLNTVTREYLETN